MRLGNFIAGTVAGCIVIGMMTSCNGILDNIYDRPADKTPVTQGQIYMDATDWHNWYYVDFDSLAQYIANGDSAKLIEAQTKFTPYPIPLAHAQMPADSKSGIYTYWFDVFGKGISNNKQQSFMPTAAQTEPPSWSIAIHRNNVRTNGGAVLATNYKSISDLPASSKEFTGASFVPDEWTQNEVWVDQSKMLQSLIGCQGIKINRVLSSWLRLDIPPMPPAFSIDTHVFLIRFANAKVAAVQLQNYMNADGTKCWLTINYKYPY